MKKIIHLTKKIIHALVVVIGATALTLAFFLVLPVMQAINQDRGDDMMVRTVDVAEIEPPPPPPPEQEPEEEPEPEEKPPELTEEAPPLDLNQLEMALNPGGLGDGWLEGDFSTKLQTFASKDEDLSEVFSMADLDQKPRVIYQPGPNITKEASRHAPGTVYILFIVNQRGAVEDAVIQRSDHPAFEKPALTAVKRWKFEPGKRGGKPVRFRMRVPITFPKGD